MLNKRRFDSDDEQWAPVSDLMAVMMLVFMVIAMILFVNFDLETSGYKMQCAESKDMLENEFKFKDNFSKWGAELDDDLTIRFVNQRVLFKDDSSEVRHDFAKTLRDFFPRYMEIIHQIRSKFGEKEVLAVRIEGHTSKKFYNLGEEDAFIKNMELSQDRAREILSFVLDANKMQKPTEYAKEARQLITANGLSSSRLVCKDGLEDEEASRRVEFKLQTKSCQKADVVKNSEKNKCL